MNAEQYAEELPALHYNGLIGDTDIQAICEMLRRLAAVESDCAPYLKEGETPAERIKRALGDADSLMTLYRDVMAERDALKAELEAMKIAANPEKWWKCSTHSPAKAAQQPLTDEQEKAGRWEWIEANCLSVIDLAGNRICASATAIDLVRRKP